MKKHKKVQVVIISDGEVLLLKTNEKRGLFWQNVTGTVEKGEDFLPAALREAEEETGLKLKNIDKQILLPKTYYFTDRFEREVEEKCFLLISKKRWDVKIDPKEHLEYHWKKMKDVTSENYKFPSNFEAFELAKKAL
ncbi:MAG: NUDIX domain-containing protein [Bacteriovoracaceae bacterium]|nr:NUDIX domain-containing protein [Bacteriovoracaceae bacterium]